MFTFKKIYEQNLNTRNVKTFELKTDYAKNVYSLPTLFFVHAYPKTLWSFWLKLQSWFPHQFLINEIISLPTYQSYFSDRLQETILLFVLALQY